MPFQDESSDESDLKKVKLHIHGFGDKDLANMMLITQKKKNVK